MHTSLRSRRIDMAYGSGMSRRKFMGAVGAVAGTTALAPVVVRAQTPPAGKPADPASTITTPPRDFGPNANPTTYVDPDVITIDPLFNSYRQGNTPIKRLWTGALWSEGPAWSGQGRYLVWSDIPNNRQLRWLEDDNKVSNQKLFSDFMIDGIKCGPDGVRSDVEGNLWVSSNGNPGGRALGYSGVTVWTPEGKLIGRIRLPEACANLCFGGPKRNRLFMAASQSLYALYVATQGAGPA